MLHSKMYVLIDRDSMYKRTGNIQQQCRRREKERERERRRETERYIYGNENDLCEAKVCLSVQKGLK